MKVELNYWVCLGKGDESNPFHWEIGLSEREEEDYKKAAGTGEDLNSVLELQGALQRAYDEIEQREISLSLENGDEYVMECQGLMVMDPDEINDLVADRDPHALAFFGLTDADDKELDEWDANDLDELPKICDFTEDFEPYSPFDEGWNLSVFFVEPGKEEAIGFLKESVFNWNQKKEEGYKERIHKALQRAHENNVITMKECNEIVSSLLFYPFKT